MTKTQFRLGALLILTAILLHNLTSPDRFKYTHSTSSAGYLVDGITGKAWFLSFEKNRGLVE